MIVEGLIASNLIVINEAKLSLYEYGVLDTKSV